MNEITGTALSVINSVEIAEVQRTMKKIRDFQEVVNKQLTQNTDYGIIPGTGSKPTLLKPGAEKIIMLMGLTSSFDIMDSTRDFEVGFFQYQVRCRLYHCGVIITEGFGSANTREGKYRTQDGFSIDNTVLKMAKKRSLIDATLLVASLSQMFTQDLDDTTDIVGNAPTRGGVAHDSEAIITTAQGKRIYAISGGNADLCTKVLKAFGYNKSHEVRKRDYDAICKEIEAALLESQASEDPLPWDENKLLDEVGS